MKKLLTSLACILMIILFVGGINARAIGDKPNDNNILSETRYDLSREEIDALEQQQINDYLNKLNKSKNPDYDYEYVIRKVGSPIKTWNKDIGWAGNQPRDGVKFENTTGAFYWSDGGYEQTVSIGVGVGFVSASISAGYVSERSANIVNVTTPNVYVKLWIKRDIESQRYVAYRREIATGIETYYSENYGHIPVSRIFSIVRV